MYYRDYYKNKRSGKLGDYVKRAPDYTELAYKEAVSRLRYFLSGNLAPSYRSYGGTASIKNLDESDNEDKKYPVAPLSYAPKPRLTAKYSQLYADSLKNYSQLPNDAASKASSAGAETATSPEVVHFIQKQEEYIEQLERESRYCRDELNNLLGKVKEVISENEHLHEAQKNKLISRMFDSYGGSETDDLEDVVDSTGLDSDAKGSPSKIRKSAKSGRSSRLEGPNIVFESRISELEAQLTQAKIDQKKIQEENNENRRKLAEGLVDSSCLDGFKRQIDNLQRDKASLEAQIAKLKLNLDQRDSDSDLRVKRGSDLMEQQLREERNGLEAEVRRLKEDLNSQRGKVRELAGEGARRAIQERSAAEQRYTSHLDEMANELAAQYDNVSKLQLELERQRRDELDLKREISMKTAAIDELKMELKGKTASLQADLAQAHAEKSSLEEELASARLAIERHQRQAKHETNRLNSEIQSLRQRLDRADADLVHSRRENLRLSEEIAKLEKDLKLGNLTPASPVKSNKDKEFTNMLETMENKHAHTVAELEAMIQSQNSLMDKLTGECRVLTDKLDHASRRHKQSAESQPYRPTNENTTRRLRPSKRESPFQQTPRKRVRFVEQEMAALQRQVEGISQSFQQPMLSAPSAYTYQAPAPSNTNIQDHSRTQAPSRNEHPRSDTARDPQVHGQSPHTGNRDHGDGHARKLSKQSSRDSFGIITGDQNYSNNDIQIPPDKFEEKDDNTTEKEFKTKNEPKYDLVDDVKTIREATQKAVADQAYATEPQYDDQYQKQNEYQPQYEPAPETYPQEQTYTGDQQAYSTQPGYEGNEYNQGYAPEYTEGQYQNQAEYPTQQYTEGQYDQSYGQQQYDYSTDPNYQSTANPNYQTTADPNYQTTADPNYQTTADPNYQTTADPNFQTTDDPEYQTTADPSYQTTADPNYQTTADQNYAVGPNYQTTDTTYTSDQNYQPKEPSYQPTTAPVYQTKAQPNDETDPNYRSVKPDYAPIVPKVESNGKPGNNSPNPPNKS